MQMIELRASGARRGLALGLLWGLAALLAMLAFQNASGVVTPVVMLGLAAAVLWAAERLRLATRGGLRLSAAGLETLDGELLVAMEDIVAVERGVFAFKPSNGFLLRLARPGARHWAPGLWWRQGRRLGVGGVTPAGPAKAIAEEIAMRIAAR